MIITDNAITIGDAAFANNQLASVSLGNNIQYIGFSAFSVNKLTSVTIPASVSEIGNQAFSLNNLTSVYLSGEVNTTSIDPFGIGQMYRLAYSFVGNGMTLAEYAAGDFSQAKYVPVYTVDSLNPYGYQGEAVFGDFNGDGATNWVGGVIINPAQVKQHYIDSSASTVSPSLNLRISPLAGIDSYLTSQNTEATNEAIFANYYLAGQSIEITPPEASGYVTPVNQTRVLSGGDNTVTFEYYTQTELDALNSVSTPNNPTSPVGALSNTGVSQSMLIVGMVATTLIGAFALFQARTARR